MDVYNNLHLSDNGAVLKSRPNVSWIWISMMKGCLCIFLTRWFLGWFHLGIAVLGFVLHLMLLAVFFLPEYLNEAWGNVLSTLQIPDSFSRPSREMLVQRILIVSSPPGQESAAAEAAIGMCFFSLGNFSWIACCRKGRCFWLHQLQNLFSDCLVGGGLCYFIL